MQAPDETIVSVTGGVGVGPVGSPAEQAEVGTRHTGPSQMTRRAVVVTVATGVLQGLSSPGSVPRKVEVSAGLGEARALQARRRSVSGGRVWEGDEAVVGC